LVSMMLILPRRRSGGERAHLFGTLPHPHPTVHFRL
jgi:hypothetical protein